MTAVVHDVLPVPDEDHSNGAVWASRPAGLPDHIRPWTPAEQAEHLAVLTEAIAGFAVTQAVFRVPARTEARS